jgi:hypothetical protein
MHNAYVVRVTFWFPIYSPRASVFPSRAESKTSFHAILNNLTTPKFLGIALGIAPAKLGLPPRHLGIALGFAPGKLGLPPRHLGIAPGFAPGVSSWVFWAHPFTSLIPAIHWQWSSSFLRLHIWVEGVQNRSGGAPANPPLPTLNINSPLLRTISPRIVCMMNWKSHHNNPQVNVSTISQQVIFLSSSPRWRVGPPSCTMIRGLVMHKYANWIETMRQLTGRSLLPTVLFFNYRSNYSHAFYF